MSEQKKSHANLPGNQSTKALVLESVMSRVSDAIVLTNSADEITSWNTGAEKIFGYNALEAIGQPITLIVDQENLINARTVSGSAEKIQCRTIAGDAVTVSMWSEEIVDDEKNLLAFCYIFHDLREKSKQEEAVKEKERGLESFMYSVSHDLRAPLRRIINYAEILEEDHLSSMDEDVKRLVTRMAKNAQKMNELIEGLLSYSRVTQHQLKKSKVNVSLLVNGVLDELRTSKDIGRVTFTIKPLETAEADPALLKRVYENLISNAIKFTGPKETPIIEIGCEPANGSTNYYLKDNGIGFDLQYSYKLFNIFQRLHNPSDYEGTGIGLAIVQQIISRHGGKVWAEGRVNEGAVFYFSLPTCISFPS